MEQPCIDILEAFSNISEDSPNKTKITTMQDYARKGLQNETLDYGCGKSTVQFLQCVCVLNGQGMELEGIYIVQNI